ncbi:hypothetical protein OSU_2224 [Vibrio cholerae PS15]|nr:hypothetical protein OSU_2224 [Vibrio cholerae PS15]
MTWFSSRKSNSPTLNASSITVSSQKRLYEVLAKLCAYRPHHIFHF